MGRARRMQPRRQTCEGIAWSTQTQNCALSRVCRLSPVRTTCIALSDSLVYVRRGPLKRPWAVNWGSMRSCSYWSTNPNGRGSPQNIPGWLCIYTNESPCPPAVKILGTHVRYTWYPPHVCGGPCARSPNINTTPNQIGNFFIAHLVLSRTAC